MKILSQGDTLILSGITELGAPNADAIRDQARAALKGEKHIDVDLAQTTFIDSCGLGALVALHKTVCARDGSIRLLNPQAQVRQILELTRMHRIFQIING